jgi:hypothetical protein
LYYDANVRSYIAAWKTYWGDYIPKMMAEKRVPDGVAWGTYPTFASAVTTDAAQSYNVLTCPFTPASLKGIIFLTGEAMFKKDQGANFGEQFTVLANSWKAKFALGQDSGQASPDPQLFYTIPNAALAPKIGRPAKINGKSTALEINSWPAAKDPAATDWAALIGKMVGEAYP